MNWTWEKIKKVVKNQGGRRKVRTRKVRKRKARKRSSQSWKGKDKSSTISKEKEKS